MRRALPLIAFLLIFVASEPSAAPQTTTSVNYHVTFPEPEHHWMQVEVTFTELGTQPLDARMSRSSPGRYAVAEFAKNVFWFEAYNGLGEKLGYTRPESDVWRVSDHDGTVRIVYKIFGDHPNGTFFGVDTTHAHLNMPAAFMWASGHEARPIRITFVPPDSLDWKIGTQLFATSDPNVFTAPNLQYFMDSPAELADFLTGSFVLASPDGTPTHIRLVVHTDASQSDVDELARMVRRLVLEQVAVFGELPHFDSATYTFLLDYVPWAEGDGMEHLNSTSIADPGISLRTASGREAALGTISHEFFHAWNVERIRPAGLEPFDFTRQNVTCCLWLAEGFTQYYGTLLLTRAGLQGDRTGALLNSAVQVINTPGRAVRSPVQMSEYAPFADGAGSFADATDAGRTFFSYYTYGAGLALALDLSLRDMSEGKLSLDDYMHLLWREHGKPPGPAPGIVSRPYSLKDLRDHLAAVTGNGTFADQFFDKYIEGGEAPGFERLLRLAGYSLRMADSGRAWLGNVRVAETRNGLEVGERNGRYRSPVPFNTPLYDAGIDSGDTIRTIDGHTATLATWNAIFNKKAGEKVTLVVAHRDGAMVTRTVTLIQDPTARDVVPMGSLNPAQKAFRDAWLGTKAR